MKQTLGLLLFSVFLLHSGPVHAELIGICKRPGWLRGVALYLIDDNSGRTVELGESLNVNVDLLAEERISTAQNGEIILFEGTVYEGYLTKVVVEHGTIQLTRVQQVQFGHVEQTATYWILSGLAFTPDGLLYASLVRRDEVSPPYRYSSELYEIDQVSGTARLIGELRNPEHQTLPQIRNIAFSPDGILYGWDAAGPNRGLARIDPSTGTVSDVPQVSPLNGLTGMAFGPDGTLYGSWDDVFAIDLETGERTYLSSTASSSSSCSAVVSDIAYYRLPLPPVARRPTGPPRFHDNLYLIDCFPCPECFEKPCDPRVNPDLDRFFISDPRNKINATFSYSKLGMTASDGRIKAAAPLNLGGKTLFVASAPDAGQKNTGDGAIMFFEAGSKVVRRINGTAGEGLGRDMDVRGGDVAVVSTKRLLRLRGMKVEAEIVLPRELRGDRGVQVAYTDDIDGDGRPEVLLGAPYASVGALREAGQILVIGSKSDAVIDRHYGRVAYQHLGKTLLGLDTNLGKRVK